MAKKSGPGDDPKYKSFRATDKKGRGANNKYVGKGGSSDYGGVAPRVGTGQKKGTVKVSKPSSVSSGWVPAKKASAKKKR